MVLARSGFWAYTPAAAYFVTCNDCGEYHMAYGDTAAEADERAARWCDNHGVHERLECRKCGASQGAIAGGWWTCFRCGAEWLSGPWPVRGQS